MAKRPDWSIKDPSHSETRYWTATPSPSDVHAGYWTTSSSSNPNFIGDQGVRSYVATPGFGNPKRNVLLKPLGYLATYVKSKADYEQHQFEVRTYTVPPSGVSPAYQVPYVYQDDSTVAHNSFINGFRTGEYDADSVDREAKKKLLKNLKDQKVNLAIAFAEREKTVQTVISSARAIAGVLTNLRKGNFVGAAKALGVSPPKRGSRRFIREYANNASNAIGNGWLALQYGWKPLLSDVFGTAQLLAQASMGSENRNAVYAIASGQSKKRLDHRSMVKYPGPPGYSGFDSVLFECKGFYLVRYGVRYTRSSAPLSSLAEVGILNPLQVAWELVPYSFVVDWFLTIGDWLSGLDATAGLSFESGYKTILLKQEQLTLEHQYWSRTSGNPAYWIKNSHEERTYTQMSRSILTDFPAAPAPRFKNPMSMSHLASAMALLKQFKR